MNKLLLNLCPYERDDVTRKRSIGYLELEHIRRNVLLRKNADVTRIGKKTKCSIFKTKHSTELKTGKQMYV